MPDASPVRAVISPPAGTHASGFFSVSRMPTSFGLALADPAGSSTFVGWTGTFLTIAKALPTTPGVGAHWPFGSMPVTQLVQPRPFVLKQVFPANERR